MKVVLVDETGRVLKSATADYALAVPAPGWAEQNPEDWWRAVQQCLRAIGEEPDAIGLTGQMHGSVFLDSSDSVVRPALLWCDQRTTKQCQQIDDLCGSANVRRITCNPPLTGFQLPKVLWLRDNEPSNFVATTSVLLPKDYIGFRLTGVKSTDVSDASGTGVFDVPARGWSTEMLSALGLDGDLFPACHESWTVVGRTSVGVPVVAGAGDQASGAVGVGAVEAGVVSMSLGTSGVAFGPVFHPSPDAGGAAHVFCHANGRWHAMGVMLSCGGAVRWGRDAFFPDLSFDEMSAIASGVVAGCEGLTFLPYLSGERCPVVDPDARGAMVGLSLSHGRGHIARSMFEGVTFGLRDCLKSLEGLGVSSDVLRITGGGAASEFWVQMIADVTQKTCVTMECDEGPAFGAAILAGVGIGVWENVSQACRETVREDKAFASRDVDYSSAYLRYNGMYPALKGLGG